jgi:hypothetical protein
MARIVRAILFAIQAWKFKASAMKLQQSACIHSTGINDQCSDHHLVAMKMAGEGP